MIERTVAECLDARLRRRERPYHVVPTAEIEPALAAWLAAELGEPIMIARFVRAPGGASKENFFFDAVRASGAPAPLLLRLDPGESIVETHRLREHQVLRAVEGALPAPRSIAVDAAMDVAEAGSNPREDLVMTLEATDLKNPDLYVPGVPHDVFTALRRSDPVHWNPEADGRGFWSITKYNDITAISKNPRLFSSAREHGGHRMFDEHVVGIAGVGVDETDAPMISMDPPEHNRYRRLVSPGFTTPRLQSIEDRVRGRVVAILDRLGAKRECEFVTEAAAELPIQVLAELLDVPQEDRLKLFDWSNSLIAEDDPELRKSPEATAADVGAMAAYASRLWDDRVAHPGSDLISMLVHSKVDGETMTKERYLGTFILLVVAGNETTRNSISGGLIALNEFPAERQKLLDDPSLLATAATEIVRYVTPILHMRRTATADSELRGKQICKGDKIILWYSSANRDEDIFADPFRFDVTRGEPGHLGFGIGQHYCLGARLAELQLRIFFGEFLQRYPKAAPCGKVRRMRSNFVSGIKEMPVRLD